MLFSDTSALVKRYANEDGTAVVDELVDEADETVVITALSVVEATSAFRRKYNRGAISERLRDDLLTAFFRGATGPFTVIPVDDAAYELAFDLVLEDDLRTLDALQLGTALDLERSITDMTFVCADWNPIDVASGRNLPTIDPTTQE